MYRLLTFLSLSSLCLAYDLHLKIAEKLAVPHYSRHGYEYPQINLGAMLSQANRGQTFSQPAPLNQPSSFSEPASINRPSSFEQPSGFSRPSSFEQPSGFSRPSSFERPSSFRQTSSFGSPAQPGRQSRFFNLYAPNLAADIGSQFGRRQS